MQAGAFHYVTKPFHNQEILIQVKRALEQQTLQRELQWLRSEVQARDRFQKIVGQSTPLPTLERIVAVSSRKPAAESFFSMK